MDSRKRAGRVEEERLQPETTASAQPITQDLQVRSIVHINTRRVTKVVADHGFELSS